MNPLSIADANRLGVYPAGSLFGPEGYPVEPATAFVPAPWATVTAVLIGVTIGLWLGRKVFRTVR